MRNATRLCVISQSLFVVCVAASLILLLGGCGGGSSSGGQAISVTVSPTTASVQTSSTKTFTATVSNDSQNKGVTWALSGSGCSGATCGSLSATSSASGTAITYTAPSSVPSPATVSLTATSVADGTKTASAVITVTAPAAISVSLDHTSASLSAGGHSAQFNATVQNDSQNKGVTWSVSGAGCTGSACGTLVVQTSFQLYYTTPAVAPTPATVQLTATSVADTTKSASATITILSSSNAIVVSVSPTSASVQAGLTQNFTPTVTNDAQNRGVNWTLSGTGCSGATCGSLSATTTASGVAVTYTAPATVPTPSAVTLTATSITDNTKTAAAAITVTAASGSVSVAVSPKRAAITTGQTQNFSATVTGSSNTSVTWEVDTIPNGNATVGTVSATGTYTPPSSGGTHTVTARSVANVTATGSSSIAVTDLAGVYTYHNNLSRDGTNTKEYALTTSTVSTSTFGKLFSCSMDGAVYAQPLWVANVSIGGGTHNVLLAVSMRDTAYLFDADASPCVTYWSKPLIPSGETFVTSTDVGTADIYPDVGILGTPVIDSSTNAIYLVTKTKTSGGAIHQRLHALNLADGSERTNSPVDLTSSITVAGTGDTGDSSCPSTSGNVPFCPLRLNQRPGLALVNGVVYVAWASHGDIGPYHGWVIGFNASTLARTGIFNSSPNGRQGGIWMAGGAPAADASNNLYLITGNGDYDGVKDFGDSVLKLSSGLTLSDWFTPSNQATLDSQDLDLGSGGAVVLIDLPSAPSGHQHLLVGGGKGAGFNGEIYVMNRDSMGQNAANDGGVVQEWATTSGIFSTPAFWNNTLYVTPVGISVRAYTINPTTGTFNTTPSSQSTATFGFPGATPSVSSSGSTNGIVWVLDTNSCGTNSNNCSTGGPAILRGYDATNLATELWNSTQGTGNTAGTAVKFTVPTIANGKVYVPTRGDDITTNTPTVRGRIDVYGLLPN